MKRTIVDLTPSQAERLETLKQEQSCSRNELIRKAVDEFLDKYAPVLDRESAFGLWQGKNKADGLDYQEQLRKEW